MVTSTGRPGCWRSWTATLPRSDWGGRITVDGSFWPFRSVSRLVSGVKKTPVCDGAGLKGTLERTAVRFMEERIGEYLNEHGRKVFVPVSVDRFGLASAFVEAGYETWFGDLTVSLGIPWSGIRSLGTLKWVAWTLLPVVSRMPFSWLYPTGESQEKRNPRATSYFVWATVVAGDCHYIRTCMPERMDGKVVVTNTTTQEDVEIFRKAGVRYLVTTTPILDGRSFGTNMLESALIAASGKGHVLTEDEYRKAIREMNSQCSLVDLSAPPPEP